MRFQATRDVASIRMKTRKSLQRMAKHSKEVVNWARAWTVLNGERQCLSADSSCRAASLKSRRKSSFPLSISSRTSPIVLFGER
jgi:hypothetical protein